MTTTPENAATWWDLTDQLTPTEIDKLTELEAALRAEGVDPATLMLDTARDCLTNHAIDMLYADIPLPAGAEGDAAGWEKNLQRDGWSRSVLWKSFGDDTIGVDVDGRQECDGSFTRDISVYALADGASLTSADARRLAELLIAAADEIDSRRQ